jgi:hypothetical protein
MTSSQFVNGKSFNYNIMPKKKDKYRYERGDFGRFMPQEEVEKSLNEFLARTKPEDIFPEAYKRAVANLERAGLIPRLDDSTPDQHQTQS